jgi:cellobiose phosphorylase
VPESWPNFEVVRHFRGVRYEIAITRQGPGNHVQLNVDGAPLLGSVIPHPEPGKSVVQVKVQLGES